MKTSPLAGSDEKFVVTSEIPIANAMAMGIPTITAFLTEFNTIFAPFVIWRYEVLFITQCINMFRYNNEWRPLRKFISEPRIWVRLGDRLLDPQTLELLSLIGESKSISRAAEAMSISFRHAWNLIDKLEDQLKTKVVARSRGGKGGGGLVTLSKEGSEIVKEYQRVTKGVKGIVKERGFWEAIGLKISARNKIVGKVTKVKKDPVVAHVEIESSTPVRIVSVITSDAADDLELKIGDKVTAIIKSTEVLIAK
jgi:molybdate transport system regulatory protein